MRLLSLLLVAVMALAQTPARPQPVPSSSALQWRMKFFHDKNDEQLNFREVLAPTPLIVYAFGSLFETDSKPQGRLVKTADGGKSWQTVKLDKQPIAADFVDANNGWYVGDNEVHRTLDGGATWKRAAKLKGVLRVKFTSATRGFAVGFPKAIWSTSDGGTTWTKVPEAEKPETKPENTVYSTITFLTPQKGIITGYSRPPRRDDSRVPAWMDPEMEKRAVPTLTLALQTDDGGATWKSQVGAVFGQTTKIAFGSVGLGLIEYKDGKFNFASEVIDIATSKTAFVDKERAAQDITFDSDGRAWIAGVAITGSLNHLPIPTKVIVMQSIDFRHWYSVPVDYKAVANRAHIAFAGKAGWLVTDSGMILALQ